MNDPSFRWILACAVISCGGTPRNKPARNVCRIIFGPSGRSQYTKHLYSLSVQTDVNAVLVSPDDTLFPGIPTNIEVHEGFANEHKKTANQILAEVRNLMAKYSSTPYQLSS
jgi:hypothetical protein